MDETIRERILTAQRYGVQSMITEMGAHGMGIHLETNMEMRGRGYLTTMLATIYGEELGDRDVYQWPAGWWQAVKDRWFPAWALKRWPVQYDGVEVEWRALYPEWRAPVDLGRVAIHREYRAFAIPERLDNDY